MTRTLLLLALLAPVGCVNQAAPAEQAAAPPTIEIAQPEQAAANEAGEEEAVAEVATDEAPDADDDEDGDEEPQVQGIIGVLNSGGDMAPFGALSDDEVQAAFGSGGLGLVGTGRGGGGSGEGTIGLGSIGSIGHGSGSGTYGGPAVKAVKGTPAAGREPEEIRRVIRQHVGKVKQCYEARLKDNPDLAGRVTMRLVIAPDGKVTEATASEGVDEKLESCIEDVFAKLTFPASDGSAPTVVNYPFVFAKSS